MKRPAELQLIDLTLDHGALLKQIEEHVVGRRGVRRLLVQIGAARRRTVVPRLDGIASDAVAVVVEQRTFGRQLPSLLVVAPDAVRSLR